MTDFSIMNKALKVAWITRIRSDNAGSWKIIPEASVSRHGGLSFLTNCNYDVSMLQGDLPPFYFEVLKHWQHTKECMGSKPTSPHEEILWNNREVLVNGKTLFYKCWFDKNILRVGDLLQKDGKFLSFRDFCDKFKIRTPFTIYFGVLKSIPNSWKHTTSLSSSKSTESKETEENISTKTVYSLLLKELFVPPTAENKILRHGFTNETIHKVYGLPFHIKNDITISMFQYEIIS